MMTDVKRQYADALEDYSESSNLDYSDSHDDKKLHTKPGRKLTETEPKTKRAAQNRAAQRAYRERKERKLKDLEDKVKDLEGENVQAATEADFLKAQVDILKMELARYRGHFDFSDLNLPTKVGKLSNPRTGGYVASFDSPASSTSNKSPNSHKSSATSVSNHNSVSSDTTSPNQFSMDFPWSKDNLNSLHQSNAQQVPDLVSGSSSSTSPLNDNILVSPDSSVSSSAVSKANPNSNNLDFTSKFEEQLDPFCVQLNEVCGTKQCPVPKYKRQDSRGSNASSIVKLTDDQIQQYNSPFSNLLTPNSNSTNSGNIDYLNDPFFNGSTNLTSTNSTNTAIPNADSTPSELNFSKDPLSFLNDTNFDVSIAFGNPTHMSNNNQDSTPDDAPVHTNVDEVDPLSFLITEESIYDPLVDSFNFTDFVKPTEPKQATEHSITSKKSDAEYTTLPYENNDDDDDDNAVVPAPEHAIRCSEIWDRITAHPKYTEIDIDGLCNELKSKAKCSERGVVINSADVNQLLEQSAILKR